MKNLSSIIISHQHKKWFCFLQKQEPWSYLKSKPSPLGSNMGKYNLEHAMLRWFLQNTLRQWSSKKGSTHSWTQSKSNPWLEGVFTSLIIHAWNNFSMRSWDVISRLFSLLYTSHKSLPSSRAILYSKENQYRPGGLTWELPDECAVIAFLLLNLSPF